MQNVLIFFLYFLRYETYFPKNKGIDKSTILFFYFILEIVLLVLHEYIFFIKRSSYIVQ